MRARAIVMALPPRSGGTLFDRTRGDRAGRAALPRDHPVRRRRRAAGKRLEHGRVRLRRRCPTRQDHAASTRSSRWLMRADRRGADCRRSARRRRCPSASCSACSSCSRAQEGCTSRRGRRADCTTSGAPDDGRRARTASTAHARLAGAVRDRLHVGRQRDLLLARRRRRARARADAVRLPRRGPVLRAGAMTYVEGASLHQERGGSTVFARYAFNELVSFIAGWAILLDYMILSRSPRSRRRTTWPRSGAGSGTAGAEVVAGAGDHRLRRGAQHPRLLGGARRARILALVLADVGAAGLLIVARAGAVLRPARADRPDPPRHGADVGRRDLRAGRGDRRLHGLESRVGPRGRGRRRAGAGCGGWSSRASATVMVVYVGIALVAVTALPVVDGRPARRRPVPRGADARRSPTRSTRAGWRRAEVRGGGRGGGDAGRRGATRRCSACRGWPTRCRPTARSRARSGGCTRRARRRTW